MRRIRWSWSLLSLGLVCLPVVLSAPHAEAATASVTPSDTTVILGATFSIRVESDAFPDLKAYQLIFKYDSAVLQYLGATAGDVLTGNGRDYTVQQLLDVESPADTAGVDCAQLDGTTSGPGVLIYFNFKAIAVGVSPIDCLSVDYRDPLNNQTLPTCVPGVVRVTSPTPTRPTSWGRLKTIYR